MLLVAGCSGGDAQDEATKAGPTAMVGDSGADDAVDDGAMDEGSDDGDATPRPDVTVAAYDQVEIMPFWASSLGETEVDDGTGAFASLGFTGTVPGGMVGMMVALFISNGGQEDIDIRDAVEPTFIAATGEEYGAEASCGTFTGSYDDGEVVEWGRQATVYVYRLVPVDASSGGMWRVTALVEGDRAYYVEVA